ncbi:hypothetical protein ABE042_11635 [Viridibacillus arvi]|uniref:hypothetical protein n=1 Tax=Viridibacillus arvi TaxID=263475 RepID=UPI003D2E24AE
MKKNILKVTLAFALTAFVAVPALSIQAEAASSSKPKISNPGDSGGGPAAKVGGGTVSFHYIKEWIKGWVD